MRTTSIKGRIEESIITDQIERAKIAFLLARFEKTGNITFFDKAKSIAERNNGFYQTVSACAGDISEYLLGWERDSDRRQGQLVLC